MRSILAVLALSSLGACAWWIAGRQPPPPADQLIFSHAYHFEMGLEDCEDCHGDVAATTSLDRSYLPTQETCMTCHDDAEADCSQCHTQVAARTEGENRDRRNGELRFSHRDHVERAEGDCSTCHPAIPESDHTPSGRPDMDTCQGCHPHDQQIANAQCDVCHTDLRQLGLAALGALQHDGAFFERHGLLAKSAGSSCAQCHEQTTCAECHARSPAGTIDAIFPEQVQRTRLHMGDFVTSHAIEARADGDLCLRCHGVKTCVECHEASGLAPTGADPRNPHPPGYALPGGAAFHGDDARLHIGTCAGCHDQGAASNCVDCHRVGGVGGNPHPDTWRFKHPIEEVRRNPMCRTCHRVE